MPFKKGREKTGGRKVGTPNKVQHDAKSEIVKVFQELQKHPSTSLKGVAKSKPDWFYSTIYRGIVPREINAAVQHEVGSNLMSLAVQVAQELRQNDNGK